MAGNKKLELIDVTYELLRELGPRAVTVRLIAERAQCTNPVIYYHFDDLDHLVLLASMRFYEEYLEGVERIVEAEDVSPYDLHMRAWRVFGQIAFEHAEVYEALFWGKFRKRVGEALIEYYQLFPGRHPNFDGSYSMVFLVDDVVERTYLVLKMAAAEGQFPPENLHRFAEVQCSMFHGLLLEYIDAYREPGKAAEGYERAMELLEFLNALYRLP